VPHILKLLMPSCLLPHCLCLACLPLQFGLRGLLQL